MEKPDSSDHVTIITKTGEFSKGPVGLMFFPAKNKTKITYEREKYEGWYDIEIFLNGNGKENLGYVSVTVSIVESLKYSGMTCVISVVDSCGFSRYPQTFSVSELPFRKPVDIEHLLWQKNGATICADRYVARKTLLDEDDDLLPGDTLTLKFEIYNLSSAEDVPLVRVDTHRIFRSYFKEIRGNGGSEFYLRLGSPIRKALAKESEYFETVSVIPMIEKTTKCTQIMRHEYTPFLNIGRYLFGEELMVFYSVAEIFDMYVVADKYLIPVITELSLLFLKMCLTDHDPHLVRFLCRNIEVAGVWEKLDGELSVYWGDEECGGSTKMLATSCKVRDRVWTYKHNSNEPLTNLYFEIEHIEAKFSSKASFDFLTKRVYC